MGGGVRGSSPSRQPGASAGDAAAATELPPVTRAAIVAASKAEVRLCLVAILAGQPPVSASVRLIF